ncbi:MAG TPA: hypothetical protein PLO93_02335, partial [Candidatus Omnitrophota bacterium]|nr:hypothetical protein [Candidatus Omnitrophota bacterium]
VEILVVIVVIGMIMAFLVPSALQSMRTANVKACDANFRAIDSAIAMCMAERRDGTANGCGAQANLLTYLPNGAWPVCPVTPGVAYTVTAGATAAAMPTTTTSRAAHFNANGTHM